MLTLENQNQNQSLNSNLNRKPKKPKSIVFYAIVAALTFISIVKFSPAVFFELGKNAYEEKNYAAAYTHLKNAYNLNPHDSTTRQYYAQTLVRLKPITKVQKDVFRIASAEIGDNAATIAKSKINDWKYNIVSNIGSNYIEQAPHRGGITRWDINKFPLKVFIGSNKAQVPPYFKSEILRAFNQWEYSTNFIKFKTTKDINEANIIVAIENTPANQCKGETCQYVVGFAQPKIRGSKLEYMKITLYNKNPQGEYFSNTELYNTLLHEIGHALGIMGHSYSKDDLMHMDGTQETTFHSTQKNSYRHISYKDLNTIKLLYRLIPDITNTPLEELDTKNMIYAPIVIGTKKDISNRKLREAENYIEKAPELAGGYVDLSIEYAEQGKYDEAVDALNRALALAKNDMEKYNIYYNFSAVYVNSQKLDSALTYAKKAQAISNTDEIREMIANIQQLK